MSTEEQQAVIKPEIERLQLEREALYRERAKLFGIKPTIYIRNLDPATDENEIKTWFSQCGPVKEVRVQRDAQGVSQCSAFVEFYYITSCDDACTRFNQKYLDKAASSPLIVQPERKFTQAVTAYRSGKFSLQNIPGGASGGAPQGQVPFNPQMVNQAAAGGVRPGARVNNPPAGAYYPYDANAMAHQFAPQQAYQAQFVPQPPQQTQVLQTPENTVYLGHLGQAVTADVLRAALASYGVISNIVLVQEKGFGFVTFQDPAACKRCVETLPSTQHNLAKRGSQLVVQFKGQSKRQ